MFIDIFEERRLLDAKTTLIDEVHNKMIGMIINTKE
jgi:hypothetical protein